MELKQKLLNKHGSEDEIEQALDKLEQESLLSHDRFIGDYIRSAERRGYGPSRIRWELKTRKGLEDSEIDKGMSEAEVDWVVSARRSCKKKFGDTPPADNGESFKRRNYLFKRGFPEDIVRAALHAEE